jgi:hypothetical protein
MLVSNRQLLALYEASKQAAAAKANLKFAYGVAKNLGRIEKDAETLIKTIQGHRNALIESYCLKDEDGQLKVVNNEYQFETPGTKAGYLEEFKALSEMVEDLLDEQIEVDLHLIKLDNFPAEMEPRVIQGMLPIIEE